MPIHDGTRVDAGLFMRLNPPYDERIAATSQSKGAGHGSPSLGLAEALSAWLRRPRCACQSRIEACWLRTKRLAWPTCRGGV